MTNREELETLLAPLLKQLTELGQNDKELAFMLILAKGSDLASCTNLTDESKTRLLRIELKSMERDGTRN